MTKELIQVADGKYTVVIADAKLSALRHGEPWQDLTGNNLVYWLAVELQAARDALEAASNGLQWYRDTYPDADSGADDEMTVQIDAALPKHPLVGYFLRAGYDASGDGTRRYEQVADSRKNETDVIPLYSGPRQSTKDITK